MNLQKFYTGQAFDAYEYFGAHPDGDGFVFRTYAPGAQRITLVGDFNGWKEQPMEQLYQSGIWIGSVKEAAFGQMYKYCIYGSNGRQEHCDPYGFGMEVRPGACSVLRSLQEYRFTDDAWMAGRDNGYDRPVNIYEMHLGSWKKNGKEFFSYSEIAEDLIQYLRAHHYNYVEFLPLSEHPFDGSWGYQNTGFFAPTSRYGTPAQLMELIDRLHHAGIGVIMDFVPVHFAVDAYALKEYDGLPLYEYPHKDVGESEWGSCNFIHSRGEVASFLQSAANYWLKEYHFDGIRMDAVSRLIYWQGDEKRGENGPAVNFLKIMNKGLHELHPDAMLIAEDSTVYPGVTRKVDLGGLGFDYKWDLGWMHDTLDYMKCHPYDRRSLRHLLTFSFQYACNERYLLPLSHDEVVHGKKTILGRLQGSRSEQFAQLKLLYMLMYTHPGKKLSFMGNELAMSREWDEGRELDWDLQKDPDHCNFHRYMAELNRVYLEESPLWEQDYMPDGIQWEDSVSDDPCVFAFLRIGHTSRLLILLNFSDRTVPFREGFLKEYSTYKPLLLLNTGNIEEAATIPKAPVCLPDSIDPYTGMLFRLK